ncbi:hypothetical protein [Actinocorallia populi]|uniref:hypothetical protein n=1 Tax=Actinocorallia populi TaxID=2079200 RepID=UPI000D08DBC1|nr:hypothetical protein [Actinocorallia populi]
MGEGGGAQGVEKGAVGGDAQDRRDGAPILSGLGQIDAVTDQERREIRADDRNVIVVVLRGRLPDILHEGVGESRLVQLTEIHE